MYNSNCLMFIVHSLSVAETLPDIPEAVDDSQEQQWEHKAEQDDEHPLAYRPLRHLPDGKFLQRLAHLLFAD